MDRSLLDLLAPPPPAAPERLIIAAGASKVHVIPGGGAAAPQTRDLSSVEAETPSLMKGLHLRPGQVPALRGCRRGACPGARQRREPGGRDDVEDLKERGAKPRSLQALLARLERRHAPTWGHIPFGDERVDARLNGGLARGRWHEIAGDGAERELPAAAAGFAATFASRCAAPSGDAVVWALRRDDLYAPGLAPLGLDPDRLIFVRADRDAEVLSVMEAALRTRGVAAVVGEAEAVDLAAGKRLQLACETGGATAFLLRRRLYGARRGASREEGSAAATRWRIASAPSTDETETGMPGLGTPRWTARLVRCRGGRPGAWIMESDDATGDVRVVAELADHETDAGPEKRHGRAAAAAPLRPRHHGDGRQRAAPGGG